MTQRFNMGLLELASGVSLLLIAFCALLVVQVRLYPPFGFLPAFIGTPLLFWGAVRLQERLPETSKSATLSLPKYAFPVVAVLGFTVSLAYSTLLSGPLSHRTLPPLFGLIIAVALFLISGNKRYVRFQAAISALLGAALTVFFAGELMSAVLYSVSFGLILLSSGAVSLRQDLKR